MRKIIGEISCSRFKVPYRLYGDKTKLVVCVGGAKQTMSAWRSFVNYFKDDYSVLVFDLPGQGRSEILTENMNVPLEDQIGVLHQILFDLDLNRFDSKFLIGGSWGAIVSAAYAAKYPGFFDRIVLGSFGTKPNIVLLEIIDTVQQYIEEGRGDEIASVMIQSFGQYIPETLQRQMIKQFELMSHAQFKAFYEHSRSVLQMGDLKLHIDLKNIDAKTLIIMGQLDTIMDMFDAKNAAQMIPDAEFHIVPNAGHFLHWEKPSILGLYRDFFDGRQESLNSNGSMSYSKTS